MTLQLIAIQQRRAMPRFPGSWEPGAAARMPGFSSKQPYVAPITISEAQSNRLVNQLDTPLNWVWQQLRFILKPQKVGGKTIHVSTYHRFRRQWAAKIKQQIDWADQQFWPEVQLSVPLKKMGFSPWMGIPPSLVWAEPGPTDGLPLRKNTNGLIAQVMMNLLADERRFPRAHRLEEAVAQLHELRQGLSDRSMQKTLGLKGIKARSGGWYKQYWRHWFPEQRPRCENIQQPFAYRLQGLAPGIFPLATVNNKLYSMIQIHHIVLIADNGAIMITSSPSPKVMMDMIRSDPKAQRSIQRLKPLLKEGWGFLSPSPWGFKQMARFDLPETLLCLERQANQAVRYRYQNDWGDVETLLRDIPFDFKRHIQEGRIKLLLNKPGHNGKTVMDQSF